MERLEASGGSLTWWSFVQVDIGEEEPKTLEDIDPHWRATCWLQVAVQGIAEEEVLWYELVNPLTLGAEGMALSLARCLVMVWQWNIKVHGEDYCPPAPTFLNMGQFITDEEMAGSMEEPHWFVAYSCTLQQVGEAAHGRKWEWPRREAMEIKASLLVCAFWHKTGMDLTVASVKLCWEPTPKGPVPPERKWPHHPCHLLPGQAGCPHPQSGCMGPNGVANHSGNTACSYRGRVVWLLPGPGSRSQPHDAGSTILSHRRRGAYLCTARALVFKGSILAYNPTMNEAEWVPVCSLANDLSWTEERSAGALANYVPCVPAEAAQITRLRAAE